MAVSKLVLECPYCQSPFEIDSPDRIRSAFSYEKPLRNSFYGSYIKQNIICHSCKRIIVLYWYGPLTYFDRI